MSDRRRRRRVKSDEESEEVSSESDGEQPVTSPIVEPKKESEISESEYENAEEEEEVTPSPKKEEEPKTAEEEVETPTDLIDEEGGEEGIAETEDVEGEFLGEDILDGSEEDENEEEEELDGEECVEEERQQGDGEECSPDGEKELDFDEDRRNPQYIPKKGTFYEHDDRNSAESPKEQEEVESPRDKKKKKLWLDEGKWGHDRYREEEQSPKSKDELIEAYGYDIRCEDTAPRARRRRRYGRGPTKYDRSWKDETAYAKEQVFNIFQRTPRGARRGRGARGGRFRGNPSFRGTGRPVERSLSFEQTETDISPRSTGNLKDSLNTCWDSEVVVKDEETNLKEVSDTATENPIIVNNEEFPALIPKETLVQSPSLEDENDHSMKPLSEQPYRSTNTSVRTLTFENSSYTSKPKSPVYERPPRQLKNPPFQEPYRSTFRRPPRMARGRRVSSSGRSRGNRDYHPRPNLAPRLMDKQVRAISNEIDRLTLGDKADSFSNQEGSALHQQKINPPKSNGIKHMNGSSSKNEDSSIRPKRYSSLRQRSLPESSNYSTAPQAPSVPPPHPTFYETGYQAALYAAEGVSPSNSQPQTTGSPPVINPPQYQTFTPAPYQESYALRLPVNNMNNAPRLFPQVTLSAGQPLIAPSPQCITAAPTLINYPPPPPPPATAYPQFTYQQYPAPPPAAPPPPVTQTPDLYRSGITYYYPQSQQLPVRHVPQKRPKAAIPIVPPPENELQRKIIEKKEMYGSEGQQKNSIPCVGDVSNSEPTLARTDTSATQPPVEVES